METTVSEQVVSAAADPTTVTFKKRGAMAKKNMKKRIIAPPSESDDSSDDSSSSDQPRHGIKRRRPNVEASSSVNNKIHDQDLSVTNVADRKAQITQVNDATKQSNWYDEDAKDHSVNSKSISEEQKTGNGTYKGLASQKPSAPKSIGPVKAPSNVRMTTMIDYAPDVCKDYKQTGYCGFGDSCKFLHERSDYKQGWELDRDWENVTKGKRGTQGVNKGQDEDDDDDIPQDIPFACIICTGPYKEPIVTRCGHYFCEKCALQRYRKDPTCAACGSGTNGVFNSAKRLKKILDKRRKQVEDRQEDTEE